MLRRVCLAAGTASATLLATAECKDSGSSESLPGSSSARNPLETLQRDVLRAARNTLPPIPWETMALSQIRQNCIDGLADLARHPEAQSALLDLAAPPQSRIAKVEDGRELPLRVYRPRPRRSTRVGAADAAAVDASTADVGDSHGHLAPPVIMFFHGGGFCICDPIENFDYACARLANVTGCVVVSVQYRQAPEHPFPAAPDDCFAATRWVSRNASALGVDPTRLATCGDSAGGNLAAVVALRARDEGLTDLVSLQVCLCPVVNWDFTTASYRESWAEPVPDLDASHMIWYARRYLRSPSDIRHPYAAPLCAESLAGVAPAIVVNASHDPLRSEGEAYAARLREERRLLRCTTVQGVMHDWYLRFHYEASDHVWTELGRDVRTFFGLADQ